MLRSRGPTGLLALIALAAGARLAADEPKPTRVVIRGTGANVTIERVPAFPRRHVPEQTVSPAITEAARLAAGGAGDDAVIAYLRRHQGELPEVIEASDVKRLRKAGAGSAVVVYLQALAAVDLGALGEGREGSQTQVPVAPQQEMATLEANGYPAYPFYGGYGASYVPARRSFRGTARFHHQPMARRPMPVPFSSRGSMIHGRRPPS